MGWREPPGGQLFNHIETFLEQTKVLKSIKKMTAVVYFPLSVKHNSVINQKCHFLYGQVKKNLQDDSCYNVYVVEVCLERKESEDRLELIGIVSSSHELSHYKPSQMWIQLNKSGHNISLLDVRLSGHFISLSETVLVLYEKSIVQSEIMQKTADWKMSQCLTELGSLLKNKQGLAISSDASSIEVVTTQYSVLNNSRLLLQLQQRAAQWKVLWKSTSDLVRFNLLFTMLVDLLLGFCFVGMFHSLGGTSKVLEIFLATVKVIADELQVLIEWLMGVPVGLKLNRPFSTVLGKFFLYHLYLWKTYIDVISPVVSIAISICSTAGLIGLSFQLSLLSDLLTLASLHCHCFYVYAARLYGVALNGLISTFRMLGGRKWNPLRQRVDTGHFTWDQLCVGMFIFCSLLLLLPTILVYYIVFLSLRLVVLVAHGSLKRLVWLINILPGYSFILWLLNSPSLAGDVQFEILPSAYSPTLKLVWVKLPLLPSLKQSLNPCDSFPTFKWSALVSSAFSGKLIYPL